MNFTYFRFLFSMAAAIVTSFVVVCEAIQSSNTSTRRKVLVKNVVGSRKSRRRTLFNVLSISSGGEQNSFNNNGSNLKDIRELEDKSCTVSVQSPNTSSTGSSPQQQVIASAPVGGANDSSTVQVKDVPKATVTSVPSRLKNISERTGGALAVLLPGIFVAWKFGKPGMLPIVFLLQWSMYYETLKIVEDHYRTSNDDVFDRPLKRHWFQKWWWFTTIVLATSVRALIVTSDTSTIPQAYSTPWLRQIPLSLLDLITYAMVAIGLIKSVMGMALMEQGSPEIFRNHLAKMATNHFALLYLIGQSSFWILTIQEFGLSWIVYPSLLVIVNDTMAYVFGCLIGKTKILPTLSPKKTVEGFIGAGMSTVAVSLPLLKYVLKSKDIPVEQSLVKHAVALSLFASIVAPFGGFLASAVKRAYNTKDFGTLIPGHGGVVDRFDCHLVTAPFVYLYLRHFWQQ